MAKKSLSQDENPKELLSSDVVGEASHSNTEKSAKGAVSRRLFVQAGAGVLALGTACTPEIGSQGKPSPSSPTSPPVKRTSPKSGVNAPGVEHHPNGPLEPVVPEQRTEPPPTRTPGPARSKVYLVKTDDRKAGIQQIMQMAGLGFAKGRKVLIKPNLVSNQSFPTTTHDDTIRTVVAQLRQAGCKDIVLGESSGLGRTVSVLSSLNTASLCKDLKIDLVNFDEMPPEQWESFGFKGMHWDGNLAIPKYFRDDDYAVVLLPCCKTHGLGGHFTMSLKLAVGITPVDRRSALHSSGNIPAWAADINAGFKPDLVVMDALSCFIDGGPTSGTVAHPKLLVASTDRVALDAVGVAILKAAGSKTTPLRKKVFEQVQIARAVELKLGASSPAEIELVGDDDATLQQLRSILDA